MSIEDKSIWGEKALCVDKENLFLNPAFDYSPNDPEFSHYSMAEHAEAAARLLAFENKAVDTCYDCPVMLQCEKWAIRNDVYGVAGGMTREERIAKAADSGVVMETGELPEDSPAVKRARIDDKYAADLLERGKSVAEIAEIIGCSTRTVLRARSRIREGYVPPVGGMRAKSEWMSAVFNLLSDGEWHSSDAILDHAALSVPVEVARGWAAKDIKQGETVDSCDLNKIVRHRLKNSLAATARRKPDTERSQDRDMYRLTAAGFAKYGKPVTG